MTDVPPVDSVPHAIARNLKSLFEKFGPKLGVGEGTSKIISHYSRVGVVLAPTTIRGFLEGSGSGRPQEATLNDLVVPFQKEVPAIDGRWLLTRSSEIFAELLLSKANEQDVVKVKVPRHDQRTPSLAKWMAGTYVIYRYAFEGVSDKDVAREVLHIWRQGNSNLQFRMSYWSRTSEPGQEAIEFTGVVLPIGRSILFVGVSADQAEHDRGRALFLHDDRADPRQRNSALGILASTRLHQDWAPCVACVLLIRVEKEPEDIGKFIQDVTLIDDTGTLIERDFGETHKLWIRAFLDNRPRGSIKEPELAELDGKIQLRDPVLRLNRFRYSEHMPPILDEIMQDPKIRAPFKSNWTPNAAHALAGAEQRRANQRTRKNAPQERG